jgi:integrase
VLRREQIDLALKAEDEPKARPRCYTVPEVRKLLRAALDADANAGVCRGELVAPVAPAVALGLLTGMRRKELALVTVGDVDFENRRAYDGEATHNAMIKLPGLITKGGVARGVALDPYAPILHPLLRALTEGRDPRELLLGLTYGQFSSMIPRLLEHGAPEDFQAKTMRSTCASYQGSLRGNPKMKSDRLGHTLAVSEKHYQAIPDGAPAEAESLEAIMRCKPELDEVIAAIQARTAADVARGVRRKPKLFAHGMRRFTTALSLDAKSRRRGYSKGVK